MSRQLRFDKSLIRIFEGHQQYADHLNQAAGTRPCTPVEADLSPTHPKNAIVGGGDRTFKNVGDALDDHERASTFAPNTITADRLTTHHLVSPTRTANVRIRRSKYGSTLSQSPARAGYATRMRQLFEDASRVDHDSPRLYPQLPNISRKASVSPSKRPSVQLGTALPSYRPESLCLSTILSAADPSVSDVQASHLYPSERSSGSWSDDSGYIVTNSRGQRCSFSVPPKERIYTWLADLPNHERDVAKDQDQEVTLPQHQCQRPISGLHLLSESSIACDDPFVSDSSETHASAPSPLQLPQDKAQNPLTTRHASDVCKRLDLNHQDDTHTSTPNPRAAAKVTDDEAFYLEEGGIQLSPLSPNVCIERGPSRHHSPRDPSIINTPCKERFQPGRLKENVVLKQDGTDRTGSPLTVRKNVLGTRFRRLQ